MSRRMQLLLALGLWISCANPVWALPTLSAHLPTITDPSTPGRTSTDFRLPLGLIGVAGTAITVKDTATVASKFATRAQAAAPDYAKGVQGAGPKWQQNASAADQSYAAGVQAAITGGRYAKGIAKHGSTKYQANATNLGSQRYGPGVANAQAAYQAGVDPYLQVLKGIDLPARGPKGSQQNMNRANAVATALRKAKVGG